MLTVAPSAAEAITALVSANGLPDEAGLRLAPASTNSASPGFELSLAPAPGPDDEVVDQDGAHVFLAPEVAGALDESTLEATARDNQVTFALG